MALSDPQLRGPLLPIAIGAMVFVGGCELFGSSDTQSGDANTSEAADGDASEATGADVSATDDVPPVLEDEALRALFPGDFKVSPILGQAGWFLVISSGSDFAPQVRAPVVDGNPLLSAHWPGLGEGFSFAPESGRVIETFGSLTEPGIWYVDMIDLAWDPCRPDTWSGVVRIDAQNYLFTPSATDADGLDPDDEADVLGAGEAMTFGCNGPDEPDLFSSGHDAEFHWHVLVHQTTPPPVQEFLIVYVDQSEVPASGLWFWDDVQSVPGRIMIEKHTFGTGSEPFHLEPLFFEPSSPLKNHPYGVLSPWNSDDYRPDTSHL